MPSDSLIRIARQYNGRSRMCAKCPNNKNGNRNPNICLSICSQAFIEGFMKGYEHKSKELK